MKSLLSILTFLLSISLVSCSSTRVTHEQLHSVLWVQKSSEYEAIANQTYRIARLNLETALRDSNWTAALEQTGDFQSKPPAVVVDVDETVLDNSPFQGNLIKTGEDYNPKNWAVWVDAAKAEPIPGAVEFLNFAYDLGVEIYYLTNRNYRGEEGTRKNLEKYGFPLSSDTDVILMKKENEGWESDKTTRRSFIANTHRILLLVGDDLNDFLSGTGKLGSEERNALSRQYNDYWGSKWIILPNPQYGGWEKAILGGKYVNDDSEKLQLKYNQLDASDK